MPNYISNQLGGSRINPRASPVGGVGQAGRASHGQRGEFTLLVPLIAADTIQLFDLPKNARVIQGYIKSDKVDTGVAIRFNVGDAANPARYFAASAAGGGAAQAVDTAMAVTGVDFLNLARSRVFLTVSTGPTTGALGTIAVVIRYTVEEPV